MKKMPKLPHFEAIANEISNLIENVIWEADLDPEMFRACIRYNGTSGAENTSAIFDLILILNEVFHAQG